MGQTTPIRSDELLRQLEHLRHTAQDPSLLLWLQRELEGYDASDELPWYRIMEVANAACLCNMALHISKPAKSMKNVCVSAIWNVCVFY